MLDSTSPSKHSRVLVDSRVGVDLLLGRSTDTVEVMEFETYSVAIPISPNFTRHLTVQAPTEEAALLLAKEHALDTGVLMHGDPWIVIAEESG